MKNQMWKKGVCLGMAAMMTAGMLAGCGESSESKDTAMVQTGEDEGIFDPRFDYFARRKEGQNCESGDFVFRMIVLQSSIINGLQRVQKCSHKNISSFLRRIKKSAIS